jgi:hypothetical protein
MVDAPARALARPDQRVVHPPDIAQAALLPRLDDNTIVLPQPDGIYPAVIIKIRFLLFKHIQSSSLKNLSFLLLLRLLYSRKQAASIIQIFSLNFPL